MIGTGEIGPYTSRLFEVLLRRLEQRSSEFSAGRSYRRLISFTLEILLILSVGYFLVFILMFSESMTTAYFVGPPGSFSSTQVIHEFFHHRIFDWEALNWSPFLVAILGALARLRSEYNIAVAEFEKDRTALQGVRDEIEHANKTYPEALQASNEQLQATISRMTDDSVSRMTLLRNVMLLPERARNALIAITDPSRERVADDPSHVKHWRNLYLAFAITMQLEPWHSARNDDTFTFVRDIEELKGFYGEGRDIHEEFEAQLHKDFIEMLNLVNGRLTSVMYRDILAWTHARYFDQNAQLLDRKRRDGSAAGLQRLFIIEESWKTAKDSKYDSRFIAAIMGAIWHDKNKYDARFLSRDLVESSLIPNDETFLASCILNDTVIKMYGKYDQKDGKADFESRRYIYRCDSKLRVVEDYAGAFVRAWSIEEGETAEKFIASCKASHPNAVKQGETDFQVIQNIIKDWHDRHHSPSP
jgi:hypothetical protein